MTRRLDRTDAGMVRHMIRVWSEELLPEPRPMPEPVVEAERERWQ